jgi:hypothetical protein
MVKKKKESEKYRCIVSREEPIFILTPTTVIRRISLVVSK